MKEIPEILKPYEEYLRSTEKPALEITFERGETLPWESKVGGCPYLKSGADYPRDNGRPMMFSPSTDFCSSISAMMITSAVIPRVR